MNYLELKQYARQLKTNVESLIALSRNNDPFYVGTNNHQKWAEWAARYWVELNMGNGSHLRAFHYRLISQETPIIDPDGKPYQNTESCWDKLSNATKWARYLGLISSTFKDRRAPEAKIFGEQAIQQTAYVDISQPQQDGFSRYRWDSPFPGWEEPPAIEYHPQSYSLAYSLELWAEKSTLNGVLEPLCRRHNLGLVTGVGELSITRCQELVERAMYHGKPTRIFYLSDFDPAGQSMPVAASRKIEWYLSEQSPDRRPDIKLYTMALNAEQVREYRLPRTPIKETELRAGKFESIHGQGAVEIDALEALYPGQLRTIIETGLSEYLAIEQRNRDSLTRFNNEQRRQARQLTEEAMEPFLDEWENLESKFSELQSEFEEELDSLKQRYQEKLQEIIEQRRKLEQNVADRLAEQTIEPEVLEPEYLEDEPPALFDSERDYWEQLNQYRQFQGKPPLQLQQSLDLAI
jgi:hypothetical protein